MELARRMESISEYLSERRGRAHLCRMGKEGAGQKVGLGKGDHQIQDFRGQRDEGEIKKKVTKFLLCSRSSVEIISRNSFNTFQHNSPHFMEEDSKAYGN